MRTIKSKFPKKFVNSHPAIPVAGCAAEGYKILMRQDCRIVDGQDPLWQNNGDTLVFALPDQSNAEKNNQIWEYINDVVDGLMMAVALMRPDEFEIKEVVGLKGWNRIVRMWWD